MGKPSENHREAYGTTVTTSLKMADQRVGQREIYIHMSSLLSVCGVLPGFALLVSLSLLFTSRAQMGPGDSVESGEGGRAVGEWPYSTLTSAAGPMGGGMWIQKGLIGDKY